MCRHPGMDPVPPKSHRDEDLYSAADKVKLILICGMWRAHHDVNYRTDDHFLLTIMVPVGV